MCSTLHSASRALPAPARSQRVPEGPRLPVVQTHQSPPQLCAVSPARLLCPTAAPYKHCWGPSTLHWLCKPYSRHIFCSRSCFGSGSHVAAISRGSAWSMTPTAPRQPHDPGSATEAPSQPLLQRPGRTHCSSPGAVTSSLRCAPSCFLTAHESQQPARRELGCNPPCAATRDARSWAASHSRPSGTGARARGKGSSYKYL